MSCKQGRGRVACRMLPVHLRQTGFSLIELMVASAVGLMIMAAILTLYLNVTRTNDEMAKTNALIENGRFAIQLLQDDIAHAGFWDGYMPDFDDLTRTAEPVDHFTGIPNLCLNFPWNADQRKRRLGVVVQTIDSVASASGCSTLLSGIKSGTDILVVRYANTLPVCRAGETVGCEAEVAGKLYFQASRCTTDAAKYVLAKTGLVLRERDCTTLARKRRLIYHVYYVRGYAVEAGDGIPTLMRSEFDLDGELQAPVALIEGVDRFRVELGIDKKSRNGTDIIMGDRYKAALDLEDDDDLLSPPVNRGDGSPDEFVHCGSGTGSTSCNADMLVNVVAVKLHLLIRSQTATSGYADSKSYILGGQTVTANDGFKRHVFSTVVRLNNVSGRRETP